MNYYVAKFNYMELFDLVRVGSRCSRLALIQTDITINLLKKKNPNIKYEILKIETAGDKILDIALSKIGDKGLFTKELESALLKNEVNFVVHSLKDVPSGLPPGLVIGCIFNRRFPDDAVLMSPEHRGRKLCELPAGSTVGTSSLRRVAILKRFFPNLNFVTIRGNLNTRMRKLDRCNDNSCDTKFDAIILAQAGVVRMGWQDRIDEELTGLHYAVGQGALACECRKDDLRTIALLAQLQDAYSTLTCVAERSLMHRLDGGCSTPIGVRSFFSSTPLLMLKLEASVLSIDGKHCVVGSMSSALPVAEGEPDINCAEHESFKSNEINLHLNPQFCEQLDECHTKDEMRRATEKGDELFMDLCLSDEVNQLTRLRLATAQLLGQCLARKLLTLGAAEILTRIRLDAAV